MKKLIKRIRAVDAFYFSGAALVSAGAGLFCVPAGLIVAGAFLLVASVLAERAAGRPPEGVELTAGAAANDADGESGDAAT